MQKQLNVHMLPFNRTPYKLDYVAIAKEIVWQYVDRTEYKIFIFGSRARGTYHRFSDLDIGITGEKSLPSKIHLELEHALNQSRIPFKVEVVDFTNADETFKQQAMKHVIWWSN